MDVKIVNLDKIRKLKERAKRFKEGNPIEKMLGGYIEVILIELELWEE